MEGESTTHHVHVVQAGEGAERCTLAFRDYLREYAPAAREYEELKHRLVGQHSVAQFSLRQLYAEAKRDFIAGIVERALAEGHPHGL